MRFRDKNFPVLNFAHNHLPKAIDMNRFFFFSSNTTIFWLRFEREIFWNSKKVAYSRCAHHLDILYYFFFLGSYEVPQCWFIVLIQKSHHGATKCEKMSLFI